MTVEDELQIINKRIPEQRWYIVQLKLQIDVANGALVRNNRTLREYWASKKARTYELLDSAEGVLENLIKRKAQLEEWRL